MSKKVLIISVVVAGVVGIGVGYSIGVNQKSQTEEVIETQEDLYRKEVDNYKAKKQKEKKETIILESGDTIKTDEFTIKVKNVVDDFKLPTDTYITGELNSNAKYVKVDLDVVNNFTEKRKSNISLYDKEGRVYEPTNIIIYNDYIPPYFNREFTPNIPEEAYQVFIVPRDLDSYYLQIHTSGEGGKFSSPVRLKVR